MRVIGEKEDLGVEHDGAEDAGVLHGLFEIIEGFLMVFMRSMGEIESSDIHTRTQQLFGHGDRARRRSQSADDLRLGAALASIDAAVHLHG